MILEDGLLTGFLTGAVAVLLTVVTVRAYRRSANQGFVLLLLALVVVPTVSSIADGPSIRWLHESALAEESRGEATVAYRLAVGSLSAVLISGALLLLARPAVGARRSDP